MLFGFSYYWSSIMRNNLSHKAKYFSMKIRKIYKKIFHRYLLKKTDTGVSTDNIISLESHLYEISFI